MSEAQLVCTCCAGDRYLLKLFRDFLFHQAREDGSPMLDWGHIVESLNKLDAGVPEKARVCSGSRSCSNTRCGLAIS